MALMNLPDGTRYALPELAATRLRLLETLNSLYGGWGYRYVKLPALESYDPEHPRAAQSFKLSDRDSSLLALRSDFTPALARLVQLHYRQAATGDAPLRLQYSGSVWHAIDPDLAHNREFTQVGIELVGVSNARADAELIHLARESVRTVGLAPRVEIGNPALVRVLFDLAEVPAGMRDPLAGAIDRKDQRTLLTLLAALELPADLQRALLKVPDLYGTAAVLPAARQLMPWPEARAELDRVEEILGQFEDSSELLIELGMARRLSYYTGITFRAYTFDFGQPLLGGGRYDGALLPYAAGFSLGLERFMSALVNGSAAARPPAVLSTDDTAARLLRAAGFTVLRSLAESAAELHEEARALGATYLFSGGRVTALGADSADLQRLQEITGSKA
jgi:ATP phosphoribosyltransferase regulatory subunit